MATIKPSDLNPTFLKRIEDKYGPISPEDFFTDDLDTYFKLDPTYKSEGGGKSHLVIKLPSFIELYQTLDNARSSAKNLRVSKDLKGDKEFQSQADKITDTFNSFRTFFRKNYPDQYSLIKKTVKETMGMAYNTPYAFGKANTSQYTSIGYKPVDQKSLRKKSKGMDYVDLYKD
jgi:hypothetical protein